MKKFLVCLVLIARPLVSQDIALTLPNECDKQYAKDSQKILDQLAQFTPPAKLKKYRNYLFLLNQFDNINFTVNKFEITDLLPNKLTSTIIAQLRVPVTRYDTCRNDRVSSQGIISPTLCDQTYAAYMIDTLKELAPVTDKKTLESYKEHMLNLKKHADTRFAISNFEVGKDLGLIATLRAPHSRYNGCRDLIIRKFIQ